MRMNLWFPLWGVGMSESAFRTEDLTKTYGSGETAVFALRGADLTLPGGEMTVLLGPSGSGKSTLLNILGGLDSASSGQAFFRDIELTRLGDNGLTRYRRDHVGFVFQFYNLVPSLTARENVALVTEIARDPMRPEEALERVGLTKRMDHFPAQMSGGEQQRVAIARALAKNPSLLLCDEPTGALDFATGKRVLRLLVDLKNRLGTTVVIITHNGALATAADRIIRLRSGQVIETKVNTEPVPPEEIVW
jgi:putative ABC transport system ATP-binding protein